MLTVFSKIDCILLESRNTCIHEQLVLPGNWIKLMQRHEYLNIHYTEYIRWIYFGFSAVVLKSSKPDLYSTKIFTWHDPLCCCKYKYICLINHLYISNFYDLAMIYYVITKFLTFSSFIIRT